MNHIFIKPSSKYLEATRVWPQVGIRQPVVRDTVHNMKRRVRVVPHVQSQTFQGSPSNRTEVPRPARWRRGWDKPRYKNLFPPQLSRHHRPFSAPKLLLGLPRGLQAWVTGVAGTMLVTAVVGSEYISSRSWRRFRVLSLRRCWRS